ncbi:DUF742 domain-containing protein [Streptomyces sp. NPDC001275]
MRTFLVTNGRTQARHRLRPETVLAPGPTQPGPRLGEECRVILDMCREERRSLTELAGALGRPLSAVRILVSDLLDARALVVPLPDECTDPDSDSDSPLGPRPAPELLEALSAALKAKWPEARAFPQAG